MFLTFHIRFNKAYYIQYNHIKESSQHTSWQSAGQLCDETMPRAQWMSQKMASDHAMQSETPDNI